MKQCDVLPEMIAVRPSKNVAQEKVIALKMKNVRPERAGL